MTALWKGFIQRDLLLQKYYPLSLTKNSGYVALFKSNKTVILVAGPLLSWSISLCVIEWLLCFKKSQWISPRLNFVPSTPLIKLKWDLRPWISPNDFGDPLIFPRTPPCDWHLWFWKKGKENSVVLEDITKATDTMTWTLAVLWLPLWHLGSTDGKSVGRSVHQCGSEWNTSEITTGSTVMKFGWDWFGT